MLCGLRQKLCCLGHHCPYLAEVAKVAAGRYEPGLVRARKMSGQSVTTSSCGGSGPPQYRLLKLPEDCHQLIMKCLVGGDAVGRKYNFSTLMVKEPSDSAPVTIVLRLIP